MLLHCTTIHYIIFFFNDTATTEIYTLSLHDALPICITMPMISRVRMPLTIQAMSSVSWKFSACAVWWRMKAPRSLNTRRSEEHTSELQSRQYLVCRLLLEKKKKNNTTHRFWEIANRI